MTQTSDSIYSFEFFPPKTGEGRDKLRATWKELAQLRPRFFSVTFGAGGSVQNHTMDTVFEIQQDSGIEAAPHLSCVDSSRSRIARILQDYQDRGVSHIVALRGDLPSGTLEPGEFRHANELVAFIRRQSGDHFHIEVAAYPEFHPESSSAARDLQHFKTKVEAGADSAITQYFYNADAYFRLLDSCAQMGIDIPIVPGIMPITNFNQLARFSDACGAELPRWLRRRLEGYADDLASLRSFGIDVVTQLCRQLLDNGAPGLHFYSMNRVEPSMTIWKNLGI